MSGWERGIGGPDADDEHVAVDPGTLSSEHWFDESLDNVSCAQRGDRGRKSRSSPLRPTEPCEGGAARDPAEPFAEVGKGGHVLVSEWRVGQPVDHAVQAPIYRLGQDPGWLQGRRLHPLRNAGLR